MLEESGLNRGITTRQLFTLSFGAIIGVGWITVLGSWLSGAGALGAAAAFAAGAALMVPVGLCYAELAQKHGGAGGEMLYATAIFGRAAGFATAWLLLLAYCTLIAFEAVSAGWIALMIFPQLAGPVIYQSLGLDVHAGGLGIAVLGAAAIGYLNFVGSRAAAAFQDVLTLLLILLSLVFIAAGFANGSFANLQPWWASDVPMVALKGAAAVFVTTPFWFAGFNVLPQALAQKSRSVRPRDVRFAILASILAAGVFYVAVILAASAVLPRTQLLSLQMPVAGAFEAAFGSPLLSKVVLFAGFLGLITTWNAVFLAATQLLHAVPQQLGMLNVFSKQHPRFGTPARAIVCIGLVAVALLALGRGALLPIVELVGICFALMFLLVACAVLRTRVRQVGMLRGVLGAPLVAAAVSLGMLALSFNVAGSPGALPVAWWAILAWSGVGLLVWRRSHAHASPRPAGASPGAPG